jgi:hypothetical protein
MARKKEKKESLHLSEVDLNPSKMGLEDEESSLAAFTRKRGNSGNDSKQFVKIELNEVLASMIQEGLTVLEERGLKRSAGDFVQSCLEGVTGDQVFQWVEKETPLEWRVHECLKDTEKAKFIKKLFDLDPSKSTQTLKALDQIFEKKEKGGRSAPKKKKKPAPQIQAPEIILSSNDSQSESSLLS